MAAEGVLIVDCYLPSGRMWKTRVHLINASREGREGRKASLSNEISALILALFPSREAARRAGSPGATMARRMWLRLEDGKRGCYPFRQARRENKGMNRTFFNRAHRVPDVVFTQQTLPACRRRTMDMASFKASLEAESPLTGLSPPLVALWWLGKGDWNKAHEIAQEHDDQPSAWVHAHLHRVEGDLPNAGYWYRRARRPQSAEALAAEWAMIVEALLKQPGS